MNPQRRHFISALPLLSVPSALPLAGQAVPRRTNVPLKKQPNLSYDLREDLTPRRITNAMWDYSWLKSHYPGGPFEDWERVTDELRERGFNTVRLDCLPLVIGAIKSASEEVTVPGEPLANWGFSDRDRKHAVMRELVDFMSILKRKGIYAILSSWGNTCREYPDLKEQLAKDRGRFRQSWERTLDLLGERDLLGHVLYVDLDQEFPYFSPYADEIHAAAQSTAAAGQASLAGAMEAAGQTEPGSARMAWNAAQFAYVRKLFLEMIPHFQSRYPQLRFTYSLTSFFKEVRAMDLSLFDVLELHIWIHSPRFDNRSGFGKLTKDRGDHDYRDYARRLEATMRSVRPMLLKEMHNKLAFAKDWSEQAAAPVVVTEAWGPWWHMDHRDLSWDWLKRWCEQSMALAARYGLWGATPWNYSHPYWKNWSDKAWYLKLNGDFLKS